MRETIELNISSDKAEDILPPEVGEDRGLTRHLVLPSNDPLLEKIREHEQAWQRRGSTMLTYLEIHREYTPRELKQAERLWMRVRPFFEPTGEDCGTVYDETTACPKCGFGARQIGPLRLELKRIPKRDIARTLGGEIVVSARLAEQMKAAGVRGYELGPVVSRQGKPTPHWHQLLLPECSVELAPETQVGADFFVPQPDEARCPEGHVAGFTVLSEVHLQRASVGEADWLCTRQAVGPRMGAFRPLPLLLISQRLYQFLTSLEVKRFDVEVAYLG
ncbi:MAG TPA: hypothetical protein VFZ09_48060 [Archangium sp.]|uniref:hypothetical protein n=1 Tax=Archangium sp. TaxID=1872627 RepID=UPI002E348919|nr:hypothetical protein [Archangium sp.]HEX5754032.1 hypothetical protein [Archangium sp.]